MRLLLALVLAGCASPRYEQVVWHEAYGQDRIAPIVSWKPQADLTCAPHEGRNRGWAGPEGQCVAGLYWRDLFFAEVALPDTYPVSRTAYAHELYHATGAHHGDPGFEENIARANELLRTEGL